MQEMKKQEADLVKKADDIKHRAEETEAQLISEHKKAVTKLTEKSERELKQAETQLEMVGNDLTAKTKKCEEL